MPYTEAYAKKAFQRHPGCGCELLYSVGKRTQRQTNWSANTWEVVPNEKEIKDRLKRYGLNKQNKIQNASALITNLQSERILKSVGAKSKNYDIMDLKTGEMFHLAEGSILGNKKVFAGKGAKKPYVKAWRYVDKFPDTKEEDWQHVKGTGIVDYFGENRKAEIHWSQHKDIGKVDLFVKEWLD